MRKLATALCAILLLSGTAAAFSAAASKWQGYLLDRQCADSVREDAEPKVFIQHHTKDCALMPNCRAKGYSVYVASTDNDKWFDLDNKGNDLAVKLLKASKRRSGFYVEVTGTRQDKVLKTQSIKEIEEPKVQ